MASATTLPADQAVAATTSGNMVSEMESAFKSSVESGQIPGAVVIAKDVTGKIDYVRSFGSRSVRPDENGTLPPMQSDTIMRMGQASVLVGTVMALQCVERGLIDLDETVERYLPDLTSMKVLAGFDAEGKPIMRDRNGIITLRHMLTDTSGISHVPISPLLREYCAKGYSTYPLPIGGETDIPDPLAAPPVGDPGAEWVHGTNIDWAGKLVERATGMDLESYMQQNICAPLGITDITFKLHQRPDLLARRADLTKRSPEDGKLHYDDTIFFRKFPEECYAGSGMFASPAAFMTLMHSLLKRDGVLLKPETVDQMFQPALNETMERGMNEHFNKVIRFINYGYPLPQWPSLRRNFGFGAIVIMQDLDGDKWRRKGSMSINCGWNVGLQIDPAAGLCTIVAFQTSPYSTPIEEGLVHTFEKAMYSLL
ncbi:Acyltransferase LovD [Colletotrichum gloeosporioides]|uniref:Acyltransferase LovD n=1 Tax=Colletotrichum gloeosporioides TaxID=474922 RepID=A0A8H4C7D1_COLGL|nr:Acyltransferase LovD [Colletotrichum gloeosporioides]KAF3798761.1 Acyltransferase LovD [Colletotrichum gloeosporioides]